MRLVWLEFGCVIVRCVDWLEREKDNIQQIQAIKRISKQEKQGRTTSKQEEQANKNNKHGNSYRGLPGNDEEPDSALPMIWLTQVLISFFKSYINNNAFKPIFTAIRMFFYDY